MTPDVLPGLGALLQSAHGKGVPEIHAPGTSTARGLRNPCRREHLVQRLGHHRARERTMATGDKQRWACPGDALALGQRLLEGHSRRGLPREQTAFLERTGPDVQPSTRHVCVLEGERFGYTPPRDREQAKHGTVGVGP
jgi:hypothetical protein